ncbi:MAG: serine/threonine-protein kinase [Planctomycetes bacterium]|nr:serine/threonine-protein kinase [Planctomycetota bacterium]
MSDDAEVFDFLDEYMRDRAAGRERELAYYLTRFPKSQDAIAREYLALQQPASSSSESTSLGGRRYAEDRRIGPYKLVRELGRGGQGAVWLAEDTRIARRVALKLLPPSFAALSAERRERLRREAELVAKLAHPAIATIYEAQIDGDTPFLAMRFVEGEALATSLERARRGGESARLALPPRNAIELARLLGFFERAARGLHAAHEAGVVHRDVKPGNLMVDAQGEPVVLDFGQAREIESGEQPLTISGEVFGTPAFMSPEQVRGETKSLDRRTDVWSLGASLWECLTLERPFRGDSLPQLLDAIANAPLGDPRTANPWVSDELAVVLATALEKDRERRYPTALEFAEDLRRLREYEPIRARPPSAGLVFRRWVQRHPALAGTTLGLIVTLAVGLAWTLYLLSREEHALRYATGRYLAERAIDLIGEDPSAALRVGLDAVERATTYQTRTALFQTLEACRLERPLVANNRRLLDIDASPDGTRALTAVDDGTVILWDLATGKELGVTEKHPGAVKLARYLGDGALFVTLSTDERLRFFNASDARSEGWIATRQRPHALAASVDGQTLVALDAEKRTLTHWSVVERRVLREIEIELDAPRHVALSADGRRAAVWGAGTEDALGRFAWIDLDDGGRVRLRGAPGRVLGLCFDASGERLFGVWGKSTMFVWRNGSQEFEQRFELQDEVTAFALSPHDDVVALGTRDRVWAWNPREDSCTAFEGGELGRTLQLAFSPDGSRLAAATLGNAVRLFDVVTRVRFADCVGYLQPAQIVWTSDGTRVLAQNGAHTANVWFGGNRPDLFELRGHEGPLTSAHFDPRGERVVTTSVDGTARLWSTPAKPSLAEAGRPLGVLDRRTSPVLGAAFAPDGERVLTYGADGRVRVIGANDARLLGVPIDVVPGIAFAEFDASGRYVLALDVLGRVWLADLHHEGAPSELGRGDARAARFSRDGRHVITAHGDGTVAEWRVAERVLERTRAVTDAKNAPIGARGIALGGTKSWYAIACDDTRARFFELGREPEAHKPIAMLEMQSLVFGRGDTRLLATGPEGRGAMKMWDFELENGSRPEVYHTSDLTGGAFDPAGRFFVTISKDGTAYVRDAVDGKPFVHLELHRGAIVAAEFSPGGPLRLLTASSDGTARVSPVDPLPTALARAPRELYEWELARERRLAEPLSFR